MRCGSSTTPSMPAATGSTTPRAGCPWVIVVLLLVGSLVILGYTILVGSRSLGFHAVGAASIALVVGLSLVVLIALVYPFTGDLAVDPEPFRTGSLAQFFGP